MKKKILGILLALLLSFALIACKPSDNGDNNGGGGAPTEIVIMHGAPHEIDPRRENFSGRDRADRLRLHEEVEKELNVKIVYKEYPAEAPWGPNRQQAIINWHVTGQTKADIYWITTIWLNEIAQANAIAPIDDWISTYGKNIDPKIFDLTYINGNTWAFAPEPVNGDRALFYNSALLATTGLQDPVDLWNKGEWTWSKFDEYVTAAKNALGEDQFVLGSYPSVWAESLVPLNGGAIVDQLTSRVAFVDTPAVETYDYLTGLYAKSLFETSPSYDTGSDAWANGDVLFHPGAIWFVRADNRWGQFEFVKNGDIGAVPFPIPDSRTKEQYRIPFGGAAVYTIAANPADRAKEELAFEVWNKLQLWETEEAYRDIYEDSLKKTFDNEKYVAVLMELYRKTYFEIHEDIGISTYGGSAWQSQINQGVKDGTTRSKLDEIISVYQNALDSYLGK